MTASLERLTGVGSFRDAVMCEAARLSLCIHHHARAAYIFIISAHKVVIHFATLRTFSIF